MNDVELRPADDAVPSPNSQSLVLRNTLFLLVAQALGMPLSILVNAVMARRLGATEFGYIYLAGTMAGLGNIAVEGGLSGTVPSMIARDRSRSGVLLGSGLAWRAFVTPIVYVALALIAHLLGYGANLQMALALVLVGNTLYAVTSMYTDSLLGFERTDVRAYAMIGQQFMTALIVVPTLLLGGGLRATLEAQAFASFLVCIAVWRSARSTGLGAPTVSFDTTKRLLKDGVPFLVTGLVIALQPNVDAAILAKLSTAEAMGWLAAARKLVGVLVFPAGSLISALYPTLCRLHAEDMDGFLKSTRSALRTATILVVPVALGCALYPDIGIGIFSHAAFGPAEDNLRVLSLFVLFLYFSMTLGTALAAAGLARPWALTQLGGVVVSAVVDPILIPWFTAHTGNGSLGVCVSVVVSEFFTVAAGLWLAPRGILNRDLFRGVALAIVAGAGMAVVARLLSSLNSLIAAPIAVAGYVGTLWLVGGLDQEQLDAIRSVVSRKARRSA